MAKQPPPGFEPDDSDRRYSRWNPWPEVGKTSQADTSWHNNADNDVQATVHYVPGLDQYGRRN
jgi:hypothetical protein